MTAALWAGGAVLLLVVALVPVLGAARARRRATAAGRDRAEALLSRLDVALDRPDLTSAQRREAERCRLLAGSALGGVPGPADTARAARWARSGLAALGDTAP